MEKKLDLKKLADKAIGNRQVIQTLKNAAVQAQLYELGAQLREMEKNLFIEGEKEANIAAQEMSNVLSFLNLNVDIKSAYKIHLAFESLKSRELPFDIVEADRIKSEAVKFFGI